MNALVQDRLDYLEGVINNLLASISAYNPSPAAAESVIEADDALSEALLELTQHQRNVQTIHQLRAATEALDERVKSNLISLADLRTKLIATPLSLPSNGRANAPVDANELLRFAQQIAYSTDRSKFASAAGVKDDIPLESVETPFKNEPSPPQAMNEEVTAADSQRTQMASDAAGLKSGKAVASMQPQLRSFVQEAQPQAEFVPWLGEDVSRKGALRSIEASWAMEQDPANLDLASRE